MTLKDLVCLLRPSRLSILNALLRGRADLQTSHLVFLSILGVFGLAHLTEQHMLHNLRLVQQSSKNWTPNSFCASLRL
jgi:hypothetical protein